jgi:hypothetical protein
VSRSIKNARVTGTTLGIEDHGCLTFMIHLDYGRAGQGFGGYNLPSTNGFCAVAIRRVLEVLGVRSWEELKGLHVRADADSAHVYRLGNIITDEWVDLKALAESFEGES